MEITFAQIGRNETVKFAFEELRRYLHRMDSKIDIHRRICETYDKNVTGVIWLGISPEFEKFLPEVKDRRYDDSMYISIENAEGIVTGTNFRSVLLAAYRLLRALGCVWHRPGEEGEKIPEKHLETIDMHISETPTSRHRCIDMIGAASEEAHEVLADWLPKVGMNSIFIEFETPHENYKAWYEHENNPLFPPKETSLADSEQYYAALLEEIKKRSLLLHSYGHGFTLPSIKVPLENAFDITSSDNIPEEIRDKIAMRDGKREYFEQKPMFTALCYSQEKVRQEMVETYVACVKKHPNVDFIHFWLSDGCNNHCECENCRTFRPSDFYVDMLNEIDARLTEENIKTKVVFLIYVDLLWAPEKKKILNPDRFIMMFAPITRLFNESWSEKHASPEILPYERNRLVFPDTPQRNLLYLDEWKKTFSGETFVFDYYLIWNHFKDMGYSHISNIIARDIEAYEECGFSGLLSAQVTRAHFPTNLPMYTMARKLWNSREDYEKICRDYYREAFGKDWAKAKNYCDKISDAFSVLYSFDAGERDFEKEKALFGNVKKAVNELLSKEVHCDGFDEQVQWYNLAVHSEIVTKLAETLDALYKNSFDTADKLFEETLLLVRESEKAVWRSFDVKTFIFIWEIIFNSVKSGSSTMVQD